VRGKRLFGSGAGLPLPPLPEKIRHDISQHDFTLLVGQRFGDRRTLSVDPHVLDDRCQRSLFGLDACDTLSVVAGNALRFDDRFAFTLR